MKNEALKGHLDLLLLTALAGGPAHGYLVIQALRRLSEGAFDLPEGTVYPALHRLERAGLLQSHWSNAETRRRRIYALTPQGRVALAGYRRDWATFSRGVNAVLGGAQWPSPA
jgi:DNA-binding PadR family transcriptional regulator